MDDFIKGCLKPILNSDVDDEIVQYIKEIKVVEDFEEFIDNIIDTKNAEHAKMYEKLKSELFGGNRTSAKHKSPSAKTAAKQKEVPRKTETEAFPSLPSTRSAPQQKSKGAKQTKHLPSTSGLSYKEFPKPSYSTPDRKDVPNGKFEQNSSGKGRKFKYQNIESLDTVGMKKGRHPCNCEAKSHPLINNCLKCGRIVCEQEGSGPCLFCDNMVCSNEEQQILDSSSKQSDKLYNRLKEQKTSKEWKKAIETRDRLVKADKSGEYKKQVFDDQGDYYTSDKWGDNNEIVPRIHKTRKDMKLALDFASRMVVTTETEYEKNKEHLLKGVNKLLDSTETRFPSNVYAITNALKNLKVDNKHKTEKKEEKSAEEKKKERTGPSLLSKVKVANEAFLADIDRGMCLTMHQPWASLLVAGIKMHEGRVWYTEHKGRLWIHAASKEPEDEDILGVEKMYRDFYDDPELVFPKKYPTSCLLGCVFVEACLSQERYRELYPRGESDSPYVLICNNPRILPVFYPMQGQHKIFALNREMHRAAKEALMSSNWV